MFAPAWIRRLFLLKLIFVSVTVQCAFSQLPFSYQRNVIKEESFCIPLEESEKDAEGDIFSEITRFGEEPLSFTNKNIFRVIDHGERDVRDIVIRKIEKTDSVCVVTIKLIRNLRKRQVFVHRKTYDLSKWNDFQRLAKKYFREDSEYSSVKTYFPEGAYQKYEYNESGNYQVLSERETGSNGMWLRDYLEYLVSPIFVEECDGGQR